MAEPTPASASSLPSGVTDPNYSPPEGRLGNLTVPQQHALEMLKKELQEMGAFVEKRMDDATLLRFLRARKWDVALAKQMLLAAEKWRKENDVDDIVKNFVFTEKALVDKYYPQFYHKTDKDGRPLYIERLGQMDADKLAEITSQERQLKSLILEYEKFLHERMPACAQAVGHPIETSCTILDVKDVGIFTFYKVADYVREASKIGQNYYPETMGKFYIINSPWMFTTAWKIIKAWLDPVTVAKISIPVGDGKKELLEQIPAENLPAEFGGLCRCPGGCSLSDAGPWNDHRTAEDRTVIV